MFRFRFLCTVFGFVLSLFAFVNGVKAAVTEDFSSDPIAGGRFWQFTSGTESSFTYNSGPQNLTAVIDNDNTTARYLSNTFPTITDNSYAFFSMHFRITAVDVVEDVSLGYFGLMTDQPLNYYADGLSAYFWSSAAGLVTIAAKIDADYNYQGNAINLVWNTDYSLFGSYNPGSRTLTVDVFDGATLVGTSSTNLLSSENLSMNRIGFQNYGEVYGDRIVDTMTLTVDNISNVPEPSAVVLLITGMTSLLLMTLRQRKRK